MSAPALIRVAAVVALLQFAAHLTLFVRARPTHGPAEEAVVSAMKTERFDFGRSRRTYWDMYFGYGLQAAGVCLVEAVLLYLIAGLAGASPAMARPMILLIIAANVAHAILVLRYFFIVPLVPDLIIAATLTLAVLGRSAVLPP